MKETNRMFNEHITEFLDYYVELKAPQYAVMLKGKWGSGKTFFIDSYKKNLEEKKMKYIYISLYGVSDLDEIETKFFEVLHPILANKKTVLAGKIAKGLLKATLKIDLDGDEKADGSLSSQLPSLEKSDLLNTENHILIFDDLERCSMDINNILGYINYFVEHQNYKAIIVANEEELDKKSDKYKKIKEKLIGKTFEFTSNANIAYDSFIQTLNTEVKELFIKHKVDVLNIYNSAGCDNLRLLRQSLFDFERFYENILEEHKEKSILVLDILKYFFIFSLESKSGEYTIFNMKKHYDEYISLTISQNYQEKEKSKDTVYFKLSQKYDLDLYQNCIFSISDWKNIVDNSLLEKNRLNDILTSSKYYIDDNSPNWQKLWSFRTLNDSDFKTILEDVVSDLKSFKFKSIIVVRHVHAILINLKIYGLYSVKQNDIYKFSISHIDYLYDNDLIDTNLCQDSEFGFNDSFNGTGLGYHDENHHYCQKFINYTTTKLQQCQEDLTKKTANTLIETLGKNSNEIKELFSLNQDKAFLHYINPRTFINSIITLDNDSLLEFGRIFKERYSKTYNKSNLISEFKLLKSIEKGIKSETKKHKGTLKGFSLDTFLKYALIVSINELDDYIKKNKEIN